MESRFCNYYAPIFSPIISTATALSLCLRVLSCLQVHLWVSPWDTPPCHFDNPI